MWLPAVELLLQVEGLEDDLPPYVEPLAADAVAYRRDPGSCGFQGNDFRRQQLESAEPLRAAHFVRKEIPNETEHRRSRRHHVVVRHGIRSGQDHNEQHEPLIPIPVNISRDPKQSRSSRIVAEEHPPAGRVQGRVG